MKKYPLILILTLTLMAPGNGATAAERPNILLIMADDLGYADVGFNGSTDITTPKLDELAKMGTIFSSAYVVHPFCGPSRMGLMSGRYPHKFGAPYNLPPYSSGQYREHGIDTSETLISTVLKDAGYHTGLMGKWHLGHAPEFHPNKRGFEDFYGFLGGGILYFGPYQANNAIGKVWDYKVYPEHNGIDDTSLTEKNYMTDVLSDKGVNFIQEAAEQEDRPFFLFMSYNAPHTVLAATNEDKAKFPNLTGARQTYAAMVYAMDRGIGRIVDELKATDQYENTLIVFLSDNGGRTDQGANNDPLKGVKGDALEGGYRVPMFFHWPKVVPAGERYQHPVSALDFYPTFAGLAGAEVPKGKELDGKDIWDAFLAGESARKGEMIYCMRHRSGFSDVGARQDQWKILKGWNGPWKLFEIDKDISEEHDLSAKHPEILKRMVSKAEKWAQTHTQPLWHDSFKDEAEWKNSGMPKHDETFQLD